MASSLQMLKSYKLILEYKRSNVQLSTCSIVSVSCTGPASMFKDQDISNVLFIPDFRFSLLSVSKLTKELKCLMVFFPNFYIFRDLFNEQVKGVSREEHGLYVL